MKRNVDQPWRGLFGLVVTLLIAPFGITMFFGMDTFNGSFTLFSMAVIPMLFVMCVGWQGQFPPTGRLPRPWRGLLLLALMFVTGLVIYYCILHFYSSGIPQPYSNLYAIASIITTVFLLLAFGMWPFNKLPRLIGGLAVLVVAYLITWPLLQLLNFSMLSFPTGLNPSPIGAVSFYAEGGPLAQFAAQAPMGPFPWEMGFTFWLLMVVPVLTFPILGMWPFSKSQLLMKQPLLGILISLSSAVFSAIVFVIGVVIIKVEPIHLVVYAVSYLFGLLLIMNIFQTWPGRKIGKQPAAGFVNIILSIIIGIAAFYLIQAFANWHFGEAMVYPSNLFAMANIMLGLSFPAWAVYSTFFDFWPLPPTPAPPGS